MRSDDDAANQAQRRIPWPSNRLSVYEIMPAMSTPLASIFGSGFLVIVPVLASSVGPYSVWGMLVVAFVAFHTGAIVRHNILCAEPVLAAGSQRVTLLLERLSDVTLLVLVLLLAGFAFRDLSELLDSGRFRLPPLPQRSLWEMVTIVAGTLIVVQGFETPRYLGAQFNSEARIRASRWSQYLSLSVYIAFVALALPIVPVLNGEYDDNSLIRLAAAVSVLLATPLVFAAGLAVAVLSRGGGYPGSCGEPGRGHPAAYHPALGLSARRRTAMALSWAGSTFMMIALASRAFALYYLSQCLVALSVCRNHRERARFFLVALVLGFVLLFAVPAG